MQLPCPTMSTNSRYGMLLTDLSIGYSKTELTFPLHGDHQDFGLIRLNGRILSGKLAIKQLTQKARLIGVVSIYRYLTVTLYSHQNDKRVQLHRFGYSSLRLPAMISVLKYGRINHKIPLVGVLLYIRPYGYRVLQNRLHPKPVRYVILSCCRPYLFDSNQKYDR